MKKLSDVSVKLNEDAANDKAVRDFVKGAVDGLADKINQDFPSEKLRPLVLESLIKELESRI